MTYGTSYTGSMSTITVRLTPETEQALTELAEETHLDRSAVIRDALTKAYRQLRADRMRAEAERLAQDPEDLAEVRRIQEETADLRAW